MRPYRSLVLLVSVMALSLVPIQPSSALAAERLTMHESNGVPYISGGIGLDEREALIPLTVDSNLQLVFAAQNRDYLNKVQVQIINARKETVLETVSEGPLLFATLPAGWYTINATFQGKAQNARVRVPARGQAKVNLVWDNSVLSSQAER